MSYTTLPEHLQKRYAAIQQEWTDLQKDHQQYILESIPKYVSVPKYFEVLGLKPSYEEMKTLADLATDASRRSLKPIKTAMTSLGSLFCYYESILDSCFDEMTDSMQPH